MNGYEKMKRLRRMKILKGISAATALSMTITGLAVAASANPVSSDDIAEALGKLSNFGIVAETLETHSHFESNFAVKNAQINNNFDLDNAVRLADRKIRFSVKSEETFELGEVKEHYFGIFCEGEQVGEIIKVVFEKAEEKQFSVSIPDEYKYKDLVIHQLELVSDEDGTYAFATVDEGTVLKVKYKDEANMLTSYGSCVVLDDISAQNEVLSHGKQFLVSPELLQRFKKDDNDGRWYLGTPATEKTEVIGEDGSSSYVDSIMLGEDGKPIYWYGGSPVADKSSLFAEEMVLAPEFGNKPVTAAEVMDELLPAIQKASDKLKEYQTGADQKVTCMKFEGSIYSDTDDSRAIIKAYEYLRANPGYVMLVNVEIKPGENTYVFNSGNTWDADVASRVVYNFYGSGTNPDNTHITIGDGFLGTIIAPTARVSNASSFCGAVYAPQIVIGNGEPHMATYRAMVQPYSAKYYDIPEVTTVPESTPVEETTPVESTVPEETTVPEVTTEETTEATTVPEVTTVPEATTVPEITTVTTTTEATTVPEVTTIVTTTEPVVEFSTDERTTAPEVTTVPAATTSTADETTAPEVTTVTEETTAPAEDTTTVDTEPEVTTTVVTTIPDVTTELTTTIVTIEIEEDTPRGNLITIDEAVPLGDAPPATGVESSVGMFIAIGCGALAIGIGAQVYSVVLKKRK